MSLVVRSCPYPLSSHLRSVVATWIVTQYSLSRRPTSNGCEGDYRDRDSWDLSWTYWWQFQCSNSNCSFIAAYWVTLLTQLTDITAQQCVQPTISQAAVWFHSRPVSNVWLWFSMLLRLLFQVSLEKANQSTPWKPSSASFRIKQGTNHTGHSATNA